MAIDLKFEKKPVWNSIVYRINRLVSERRSLGKDFSNINERYIDENIL